MDTQIKIFAFSLNTSFSFSNTCDTGSLPLDIFFFVKAEMNPYKAVISLQNPQKVSSFSFVWDWSTVEKIYTQT